MKKLSECMEEPGAGKMFFKTEKKKTFSLTSEEEFACRIVAIDKCVFNNIPVRRCDFLFIVPKEGNVNEHIKKPVAYYVELKGDDLRYVCEQLANAIERTKGNLPNHRLEARVVSTKGFQPKIEGNSFFRKVRKMIGNEIKFCKVHKGNFFNHKEILK